MIEALFVILLFQLIGEGLHAVLHVPVPGPVIGMFLLAAVLVVRRRLRTTGSAEDVDRDPFAATARTLISHMGLLFVPAGVGVVAMGGLIGTAWLSIGAALVLSTVLGLLTTGWVMHLLLVVRGART